MTIGRTRAKLGSEESHGYGETERSLKSFCSWISMMARTADLKRKRDDDADADETPNKVARIDSSIHAQSILHILETEDAQGLLDTHAPSLRELLSKSSPISVIRAAIAQLPQHLSNLATALLDNESPSSSHSNYALVQHLPSGDWWSSLTSLPSPSKLQTAKAELVSVLPSPSSFENPASTLASYSSKSFPQKKIHHSHRIVSTGAFLNYGPFSSFAPSFDQDIELVGRRELGQVLYYQEEKMRSRQSLQDTSSVLDTPKDRPVPPQNDAFDAELDLDSLLLPPDEVKSLKASLNSLELENSVQKLLERNQRALERLKELQSQRLTNHPATNAEEGSEEWDTGWSSFIISSSNRLISLISVRFSSGHP
jgi:hypothetical protein